MPLNVERNAASIWPFLRELALIFNIATKSDLLVGIKCLETGIYGAYQNVLINLNGYEGKNEKVVCREI